MPKKYGGVKSKKALDEIEEAVVFKRSPKPRVTLTRWQTVQFFLYLALKAFIIAAAIFGGAMLIAWLLGTIAGFVA